MATFIPIHENNETFSRLMRGAVKAIRNNDEELLSKVKAEFAEADISLLYNDVSDKIRVIRKECPPVDYLASRFEV